MEIHIWIGLHKIGNKNYTEEFKMSALYIIWKYILNVKPVLIKLFLASCRQYKLFFIEDMVAVSCLLMHPEQTRETPA